MRVIRQQPWPLVAALRHEASQGLRPAARPVSRRTEPVFPSADTYEQADRYLIAADLPGIDPSAVKIELVDGVLEVAGERRLADDPEHGTVLRSERARGAFARRFVLPESAAAEGIEARYRDGVLTISIPKVAAAVSRRIEVRAA